MNWYECVIRSGAVVAVGICRHRGAGVCLKRLGDSARHRVGGMRYGFPHHLKRAELPRHGIARKVVRDSQAPEPFRAVR